MASGQSSNSAVREIQSPDARGEPFWLRGHRLLTALGMLAVALAVLFVFVLPALAGVGFQTGTPSNAIPIGTVVAFAGATSITCPGSSSFSNNGCVSGHYAYVVSVSRSSVHLADFGLEVENTTGGHWAGASAEGFTILNSTGEVIAQYAAIGGSMAMSSAWTYQGLASGGTTLSTADSIVLDMGVTNTASLDLTLSALAVEGSGFSGNTNPLVLG